MDTKIRFQDLMDTYKAFKGYKQALEQLESAYKSIWQSMQEDNKGQWAKALGDKAQQFQSHLALVKVEVTDIEKSIFDYVKDMTSILNPRSDGQMLLVDSWDIGFNLGQIESDANIRAILSTHHQKHLQNSMRGYVDPSSLNKDPEELERERRNQEELNRVQTELIPKYEKKIQTAISDMKKVHKKAKEFEEADKHHAGRLSKIYDKHTTFKEHGIRFFVDTLTFIGDIDQGLNKFKLETVDLGKGIIWYSANYVWSLIPFDIKYANAGRVYVMDKNQSLIDGISQIIKHPIKTMEAIGQSADDSLSENSIAFYLGNMIPDAAMSFIPGAGVVGKVKKVTKAADKLDDAADVSKVVKDAKVAINPNSIKIHTGRQDKHIPGTSNYKQEITKGKYRSILSENPQKLLDEFAGTGQKIGTTKERVDFGRVIGKYYDEASGSYTNTTKGIIHYNNKGQAHIVPARP